MWYKRNVPKNTNLLFGLDIGYTVIPWYSTAVMAPSQPESAEEDELERWPTEVEGEALEEHGEELNEATPGPSTWDSLPAGQNGERMTKRGTEERAGSGNEGRRSSGDELGPPPPDP